MTLGITGRAQLDANRRELLTGVSSADGVTPLPVEINPTTGGVITTDSSTNTTGTADNRKTVTTAGTRVQLASSTACKWVIIQALRDNTGVIAVGGSTVVAASGTERGSMLYAGDSVTVLTSNLNTIYLDSTVNGEGVNYTYGT